MGDDYLDDLKELRESLRWLLNKKTLEELIALAELIDKSYVDSYCRIKENSEYGKECGYALKAKDLFMKFQEKGISDKIKKIYKEWIEPLGK